MFRKIFLPVAFCAMIFASVAGFAYEAFALSNSADAFMSLPFGHTYARTQKRMENSGAKVLTPRQDTLTMEGFFEGFPARFVFGFYKKKILKTKAAYIQSSGNANTDKNFYLALQRAYNAQFGSGHETAMKNPRSDKKLIMRNIWTPDKYTTITLTFNPEVAGKRIIGNNFSDRPIQIIYKSDKWD